MWKSETRSTPPVLPHEPKVEKYILLPETTQVTDFSLVQKEVLSARALHDKMKKTSATKRCYAKLKKNEQRTIAHRLKNSKKVND